MTSEIRANTLKNRVGLGTVSFTNTGPVVSGIVTANTFRLPDATSGSLGRLQLGNGLHFSMYHDGTNSHIVNNNGYLTIQSQAGVNGIFIARNAEVNLYFGSSVRLQTSSAGVTVNKDLDVDGHTNLDNVSVAGITTHYEDVLFSTANGNNILIDKSDNSIRLGDSVPMYFGTNKMWLMHNGSTGYLNNVTGSLYIRNESAGDVYIQGKAGEHSIICNGDGDVQLYYDGGIVAQTTQYGFQITNGALDLNNTGGSGASIRCQSVGPFYVGAAAQGDLILYCQDNTNNSVILQANTGEKYVECNMGGSVDLYHHGGSRFKTTNEGATFFTGSSSCVVKLTSNNSSEHILQAFNNDLNIKAPSSGGINLVTNASNTSLSIQSDGDIGLATASPNATGFGSPVVSVGKSGNPYAVLELQATQPNDGAAGVVVCHNSSGSSRLAEIQFNREGANNTGSLSINTYGAGSASEVARFNASKQLLLGTTANRTINSHAPSLQVTGTTYSSATVSIINNEANANGSYIFLGKQRSGAVGGNTAVQANDIIGQIRFPAGDGTDMENYVAQIEARAQINATSNNTSGYLDFYTTRQNGSSEHKMRMTQNSNHSHLFSMGTSTSHLNNCSTPDRTSVKIGGLLHLEGPFGHNATPGMYYNCYSGGNDLFYRGTGAPSGGDRRPAAYGQKFGGHYFYGDTSSTAWTAQQQITTMQLNMNISSQGYVTKPQTPAFFATHTSADNAQTGTLVYNTSGNGYYNNGGHLNVSTGKFTAPVNGIYHFHFHGFFQTNQSNSSYEVVFRRINSNGSGVISVTRQYGYRDQATNQYGPSISMQYTGPMTTGQTMEVRTSTLSFHGANGYYFGGYLLG